MHRCLILNANYEYLAIIDRWIDALTLVLVGKADAIAHYQHQVRSARAAYALPAVAVMRGLVHTRRRHALFESPTKTVVLARDGFSCQYCGARISLRTGTRDHVIPSSRGGPDTLSNVVAACLSCNLAKGARTPAEARMPLRSQPRALHEEEKLACLMRTVRSDERSAWAACLREHGIILWTSRAA